MVWLIYYILLHFFHIYVKIFEKLFFCSVLSKGVFSRAIIAVVAIAQNNSMFHSLLVLM